MRDVAVGGEAVKETHGRRGGVKSRGWYERWADRDIRVGSYCRLALPPSPMGAGLGEPA